MRQASFFSSQANRWWNLPHHLPPEPCLSSLCFRASARASPNCSGAPCGRPFRASAASSNLRPFMMRPDVPRLTPHPYYFASSYHTGLAIYHMLVQETPSFSRGETYFSSRPTRMVSVRSVRMRAAKSWVGIGARTAPRVSPSIGFYQNPRSGRIRAHQDTPVYVLCWVSPEMI